MRKTSKIAIISLLVLILPTIVFAAFKPATLTNGIKNVAVYSDLQAKTLFSQGFYLLGGSPSASNSCQINCPLGGSNPDFETQYLNVNGDIVYRINVPFKDATTTIVSFANPFGTSATSTVEMARLNVTNGTSTVTIACGASATAYAAPTYSILSSDSIATSSTPIVENNIATAYVGNSGGPGGGSVAKIMLTKAYPYFVCTVTTTYPGALTEKTNTFDGKILVRVSQTR